MRLVTNCLKKKTWLFLLAGIIFLSGCFHNDFTDEAELKIPYYFIAIYNNSYHGDREAPAKIKKDYEQLKKIITRADEYRIKLTLMFPPQWVNIINKDDLKAWEKSGHEVGAYHQSVFHKNWDGYTNFSDELATNERRQRTKRPESILGDLGNFMERLKSLDIKIDSGCLGEEISKAALPEEIRHSTCSGFANFGQPGRVVKDTETPHKGINEYISIGEYGGQERKWLAHYQISDLKREKSAEETFYSMVKGVFGTSAGSAEVGSEAIFNWLDFLHQRDRDSLKSRTVSEVIKKKILPEKNLP